MKDGMKDKFNGKDVYAPFQYGIQADATALAGRNAGMRILRLDTKDLKDKQKRFAACVVMCLVTEKF